MYISENNVTRDIGKVRDFLDFIQTAHISQETSRFYLYHRVKIISWNISSLKTCYFIIKI